MSDHIGTLLVCETTTHYFLLIADLIKIDVSDNFVNLSEHFQANVWRFKL